MRSSSKPHKTKENGKNAIKKKPFNVERNNANSAVIFVMNRREKISAMST